MLNYYRMSIKENFEKRGLEDILNPKKWKVFLLSALRSLLLGSPEKQVSQAEQLIYRMNRCGECVQNGACVVCSCPVPASMIEPDNWCEGGMWDEMLDEQSWEKKKQEEGIQIVVKYVKV